MNSPSGAYWIATAETPAFPALAGDVSVDVAIVGGGIVGTIAARLLKDEGFSVALVEAARVGQGVTGKSTAKITSQHNLVYTRLRSKFGTPGARTYAEANEAGLRRILALASQHGVDADIETKPAYTYTLLDSHAGEIEAEVELAREIGLPASATTDIGLPFTVRAAMRWDDQAQFHPVKFAAGLATTIPGDGCHVFEHSRVVDWDSDRVATAAGSVKARHVVMATHLPLGQIGAYYAQSSPHMHPVIAGPADPDRIPDGMYISVEGPRHSVRSHRSASGEHFLVCTGPAFKPGHVDDERNAFAEIERFVRDHFAVDASYRWTNEDYAPVDGTPFVGWSDRLTSGFLVATGFDAWGISNGAAAAIMIADLLAGRENRWIGFFDASRLDVMRGARQFAKASAHVAAHLLTGYLSHRPEDPAGLQPGHAGIFELGGKNVGAFRDESGELHLVSAACSHMGCTVGWNEADRTWDCPCHGSRFALDGAVIHGPATQPLEPGSSD
jgi:glycine/D-amino acid oxidase-like deaminating enzyme/nitrite reductase/ring-hydroxylating ferredoxin subunit